MHVCYMFRPVLRLSSGMSIQKPYKGRYKKHLRGPLSSHYFYNVKTQNIQYTIQKMVHATSVEVAFTSSHVHIAVRNTLYKLVYHSARDIMNIISLPNIAIQIRYLRNTYTIQCIHLALWNVSWILYTFCQEKKIWKSLTATLIQ